jgi:hypothetical protein
MKLCTINFCNYSGCKNSFFRNPRLLRHLGRNMSIDGSTAKAKFPSSDSICAEGAAEDIVLTHSSCPLCDEH